MQILDSYNPTEFQIENRRVIVLEKNKSVIFVNPYWVYITKLFPDTVKEKVFDELCPLVHSYGGEMYGKPFVSSRQSCFFADLAENRGETSGSFSYSALNTYDWSASPTLTHIKGVAEQTTNVKFNKCLVHLYKDGESTIGYHSDREAITTSVFSISFGATRKFRFRRVDQTSGYDYEIHLNSGDVVWMLPPNPNLTPPSCQQFYKHSVPVEKTVTEPRINLTFRHDI